MRIIVLLSLLLAIGALPLLAEDETWSERIEFSGDLRLRYEGFDQEGRFDEDRRDRFRFRLRFGLLADVNDWVDLGLELRSGNPDDPVSDNQTLDGGFTKKDIAIAQAFALFAPAERVEVIAGKFDPGDFWQVSDLQWDDDVVVEGALERFTIGERGPLTGAYVALYQYMLEEQSSAEDAYILGVQLAPSFALGAENALQVGGGLDVYEEPQLVVNRTLSGALEGNPVTNLVRPDGTLVSEFEVANAFVVLKNTTFEHWPLKLSAFYYENLGAEGLGERYDTAWFLRLAAGSYKEPGAVAVRYSRYYSEPDALFYAYAQSDTTRASDVDGHRFDLRVGLPARSYLNFTWYHVESELDPDIEPVDRWQADYILRF
jgi:hypothetical protein